MTLEIVGSWVNLDYFSFSSFQFNAWVGTILYMTFVRFHCQKLSISPLPQVS